MAASFIGFNHELNKQMRVVMNELADYLAAGGCKDFLEYRHITGKIEGLAVAERMLLDLMDRAEKE